MITSGVEYQNIYNALWGLAGLVFWLVSFFYLFKKAQIYLPAKFKKKGFSFLRLICLIAGLIGWGYVGYALTGPRIPIGMDKNTIEINDVFVVLDLSRSMLAEDLKPNRFEAAKQKIQEFVALFPRDRIGIIIFAEKVFTLLPLSTDLNLINRMVAQLKLGTLGDGTNIGDALALGVGRLNQSLAKNKVLILLTDGVSNVGLITPLQAAEMAAESKIKIYTIGIGGAKDARLPMGTNAFGVQRYQNIPGGSVDEKSLAEMAKLTGGKFYMAKDNKALENVLGEINKLERTEIEQSGKVIYKELFYDYLLIGVLLLFGVELTRKLVLREGV